MTTDTNAAPAAALPAGQDDPGSPWYVPPELRAHYVAPTVDDIVAAANVTVFAPLPGHDTRLMGNRDRLTAYPVTPSDDVMAERERLGRLYGEPRYKAHLIAIDKARAAAERAAADRAEYSRWEAAHRCAVCGVVDVGVTTRRILDMDAERAYEPDVRLVGQTCAACATTIAGVALARHADEPLRDGRTRRAAAATWLAGQ